MEQSPFPAWLDTALATDAVFAAAYDAVDAPHRAELKLAIARLAACLGEVQTDAENTRRTMRQGFVWHASRRPVDWAVVFWEDGHIGPTRLLAALMPAILAGVPHILACRVRSAEAKSLPPFATPDNAPLLAALELAGQELAADISPDMILGLVRHLEDAQRAGRSGRIAVLGGPSFAAYMSSMLLKAAVPNRLLAAPVTIGIASQGLPPVYQAFPHGMLAFAHPDAVFAPADQAAPEPFSAVLCAPESISFWLDHCPLVLTPGQEACWIWPDLSPDFFMDHNQALA